MPCASFEDRLVDYGELSVAERQAVDVHLAECSACRDYLSVLAQLDDRLTTLYRGIEPSPAFNECVRARLKKPSWIPELLDLIGWAAILALLALLAPLLLPFLPAIEVPPDFPLRAAWAAATLAVGMAVWICARCFAELKR